MKLSLRPNYAFPANNFIIAENKSLFEKNIDYKEKTDEGVEYTSIDNGIKSFIKSNSYVKLLWRNASIISYNLDSWMLYICRIC